MFNQSPGLSNRLIVNDYGGGRGGGGGGGGGCLGGFVNGEVYIAVGKLIAAVYSTSIIGLQSAI